jgi:hypothetical protein
MNANGAVVFGKRFAAFVSMSGIYKSKGRGMQVNGGKKNAKRQYKRPTAQTINELS